jgi:3-hydroxymyristoyl/3-hydroxydecanoyl-(acyl carrier protein) dehydratase
MTNPVWHLLEGCACTSARIEGFFHVPDVSPWFDGHFPGDPILPGVAMLGMVQDLLRRGIPEVMIRQFRRVRFRKIVNNNAHLHITIDPKAGHEHTVFLFEIKEHDALICSGIIEAGKLNSPGGEV